ncbi:MAG: hypothetical protein AAF251_14185 [Pseudomonadota bacterium]
MALNFRIGSRRTKVLCVATLTVAALPLAAQPKVLGLFEGLTKGEWTVKYRDGSPDQKLCLKTGEELIQLKHGQSDCSRYVVEESPSQVTVQYTCPKEGFGRTQVRRENSSLVQIESQGFASGLPFEIAAEARLTGTCSPTTQ